MKLLKFSLILLALSVFILACQQETTETNTAKNANAPTNTTPTATETPDELASGRKNYKEQCARCHKEDGTGGEVDIEGKMINVEDLTTEKMFKESDEEYIEYMVEGIPDEGMPSFKDVLSKEEMQEIVQFIRTEFQAKYKK